MGSVVIQIKSPLEVKAIHEWNEGTNVEGAWGDLGLPSSPIRGGGAREAGGLGVWWVLSSFALARPYFSHSR